MGRAPPPVIDAPFAVEPVPPKVGRKHDPRGREGAALLGLLRLLRLTARDACTILGLSEAATAGVLCDRLRLVEDGSVVDGHRGVWCRAAHLIVEEGQRRELAATGVRIPGQPVR